jgi:hypothetical protein
MKKILFYSLLACTFMSCTKLDLSPTDKYAPEVVWKSVDNLDTYVRGLYSSSFSLYAELKTSGSALSDGYSDLLKYTLTGADANKHNYIESGSTKITPSTLGTYFSPWASTYIQIKNCNEFLINVKKYGGSLDQDKLKIRIAEVRFLRAFLYHKLVVRHGGVILRVNEDKLDGPSEKNKARATTSDCWDFVISELETAAKDLPTTWDASNLGRITKGAAFGMIARSALYAERWDKAIVAVDSVEKLATSGVYKFVPLADLFTTPVPNNKELMIYYNFVKPDYVNDYDSEVMPGGDVPGYGANICPTNELVDLYAIKVNGTWQKFDWHNLASYNNKPYENRDPRFYATILYNGESWKGRTIQSYVGGADGFQQFVTGATNRQTSTGYYIRKFAENKTKLITEGNSSNWIEMRYTEMLFIKSEAYAQKGDWTNAYAYLNAVRTRPQVGLDAKPIQTSWNLYLDDLQKEKACEFACEGHRYWDLRRWNLGSTILTKQCHGTKITGTDPNYIYSIVLCDDYARYYDDKYNIFPIPEAETLNNPLCIQNDNWK